MNRRDLFKFAVSGAGLLLLPPTTYFLPPHGGWIQRLRVRKTRQWTIDGDLPQYLYDASWDTDIGPKQYCVQIGGEADDEIMRQILVRRCEFDNGSPNSLHYVLTLPRGVEGSFI